HAASAPPPPPTAVWALSPVRRRRGPCCRSEPPPWPLSPASRMDGSWGSGRPICPTPCCVPRSADEAVARGEAVAVIGAASWSGRAIGSHTCVDLPGGSHERPQTVRGGRLMTRLPPARHTRPRHHTGDPRHDCSTATHL